MSKFYILPCGLLALALILTTMGCEDDKITDKAPIGPVFNMDAFQANIESGLGTDWVGYSYVISQNGQFARDGIFGDWTKGVDGETDASTEVAVYLASLNKTIAAVAVLKAMEEFGPGPAIMLNQSISDYLPNQWSPDPTATSLTWLHVLSHRTGYPNSGSDYATVRNLVENNTATANATFQYSNGNYGLIRILLASLTGTNYTTDDTTNDNLSQGAYIQYTDDKLFTPAGVTTQRTLQNNVRYYNTGDDNMTRGWPVGDRTPNLGAGGFYLSALDYARFMAFLLHSEDIISEESRALMLQFFLGLADGPDPRITPTTGLKGTYFTKAGALGNGSGQGCRNILMIFPNDVEIVILGNTSGVAMDNTATFRTMVANAYDNAWE